MRWTPYLQQDSCVPAAARRTCGLTNAYTHSVEPFGGIGRFCNYLQSTEHIVGNELDVTRVNQRFAINVHLHGDTFRFETVMLLTLL